MKYTLIVSSLQNHALIMCEIVMKLSWTLVSDKHHDPYQILGCGYGVKTRLGEVVAELYIRLAKTWE